MIAIPDKAKHFLILSIKLIVVGGAFYFIYSQLAHNEKLDWQRFQEKFSDNWNFGLLSFILLLTFLNRFFEILKWQNLVGSVQQISIGDASKQVLAALTAGTFTPNGIGEYGAKALYFEKKDAKKIVFLNLICNGIQMLLSVVVGIFGLLYFNTFTEIISPTIVLIAFGVLLLTATMLLLMRKVTIKGYSVLKILKKVNELPSSIHRKNVILAVGRYLVFSHQYYFLFRAFDVEVPYLLLMAAICSVYFLASSLPTFQFLDFAVKGSVAVYFFNLLGVNEWIVIFVTTLMWLLNVVIPVIAGSYFVLKFKSKWRQS